MPNDEIKQVPIGRIGRNPANQRGEDLGWPDALPEVLVRIADGQIEFVGGGMRAKAMSDLGGVVHARNIVTNDFVELIRTDSGAWTVAPSPAA